MLKPTSPPAGAMEPEPTLLLAPNANGAAFPKAKFVLEGLLAIPGALPNPTKGEGCGAAPIPARLVVLPKDTVPRTGGGRAEGRPELVTPPLKAPPIKLELSPLA